MGIDTEKLAVLTRGVPRGEAHGNSKLDEATVVEIRRLHADGYGYTRIARAAGVSPSQVQRIVKRRSWAHVG